MEMVLISIGMGLVVFYGLTLAFGWREFRGNRMILGFWVGGFAGSLTMVLAGFMLRWL